MPVRAGKLAGRLFNSDKVVALCSVISQKTFVRRKAASGVEFSILGARALLIQDVDTSIQYARHAVAIEQHPFPWTTLAGLLI